MFETIGTLIDSFNLLGMGLLLGILGLIFAISQGMQKRLDIIFLWIILLTGYSVMLLFKGNYIQGGLYIVGVMIILLYGIKFLNRNK